jgi:hypothetical protein
MRFLLVRWDLTRSLFFDKQMFLQNLKELIYVILSTISANTELSSDRIDDFWLGVSLFEESEDTRSNEIQVEHLASLDIQYDRTIFATRAANVFCNSVHRGFQ